MRNTRKLNNGHFIVVHYGVEVAREYRSVGNIVMEIPVLGSTYNAVWLPNGNMLVSCDNLRKVPIVFSIVIPWWRTGSSMVNWGKRRISSKWHRIKKCFGHFIIIKWWKRNPASRYLILQEMRPRVNYFINVMVRYSYITNNQYSCCLHYNVFNTV